MYSAALNRSWAAEGASERHIGDHLPLRRAYSPGAGTLRAGHHLEFDRCDPIFDISRYGNRVVSIY
jgi:hypothetical protein